MNLFPAVLSTHSVSTLRSCTSISFDLDAVKVSHLREEIGDRSDVEVYKGDCNTILIERVFPKVRYEDYRRALCVLDPYGLHLNWKVISEAGRTGSIEIFLNFPVADMNRNVLWHKPDDVDSEAAARMTAFWGDESWKTGRLYSFETAEALRCR